MSARAVELIQRLQDRGIEMVVAGDRLRCRPVEALTEADVADLRQAKVEVVFILAYHNALREFWHLTASNAADPVVAVKAYNLVIKLIDDVGEPTATRLRNRWEREWHQQTGRCPRCGERGPRHT